METIKETIDRLKRRKSEQESRNVQKSIDLEVDKIVKNNEYLTPLDLHKRIGKIIDKEQGK